MGDSYEAAVIGAGVSGLCAAHYLAKHFGRNAVRVFEAGGAPGGTARTDSVDGYVCEWGPNGFLDKEPRTLAWIEALGLTDQLVRADATAAHRFILRRGELHEVRPPPAFLRSPLLSLPGRARLLCEPLMPTRWSDGFESVWDFAARRVGREAADVLVTPMVSGVFGGDAKRLNMADCFPRLVALEREHGSLFNALRHLRRHGNGKSSPMGPGGVLTSFAEGMGVLPAAAARAVNVSYNAPVEALAHIDDHYRLRTADGECAARRVIVATPAHAAACFVADLAPEAAAALAAIPYAGLAVLCTGHRRDRVRHDLDGFGFLAPRIERRRVLGCIWASSIFPGNAPEGHVLLRSMYGGATDPEAAELPDADLLEWLRREVHPLLGIEGAPDFVRIYRHHQGIPQYDAGHRERLRCVEAAEEALPGLAFAGNAYRGVGLNDCVVSALRAVDRVR